jgi:hypothetical protein
MPLLQRTPQKYFHPLPFPAERRPPADPRPKGFRTRGGASPSPSSSRLASLEPPLFRKLAPWQGPSWSHRRCPGVRSGITSSRSEASTTPVLARRPGCGPRTTLGSPRRGTRAGGWWAAGARSAGGPVGGTPSRIHPVSIFRRVFSSR